MPTPLEWYRRRIYQTPQGLESEECEFIPPRKRIVLPIGTTTISLLNSSPLTATIAPSPSLFASPLAATIGSGPIEGSSPLAASIPPTFDEAKIGPITVLDVLGQTDN